VRRLLYVEDNEDNLYMLQLWFDVLGEYEILSARDGAAGLAMAAAEQPDLILMDLNLPEIDGWEATRRLKADPATRDIPIIALSAHAMAGDREKALATGCDDFDTKPIEFDRLLAKIEQALTNRQAVGIAMATAEKPDLILMDLNLPQIDGWEATRRLKADPATRDIPIIALSSHAMAGDREKALAAGCDDFDTKPVEFGRLLAKIEQALAPEAGELGSKS